MQPKLPLPAALIQAHADKIQPLIDRFEKEKKLHPSLIITGLTGVGKKEIATYFIQILFCDASPFAVQDEDSGGLFGGALAPATPSAEWSGAPCGKCASCKRAIDQQWIDLYWFDPESADEERMGTHKIETFRELKGKMGFGPTEEPFKVVVITEADRMTPQASNSILKILEEPPPGWVFILTAADSSRLLPTIVSRCIELKLSPLTPEQIFEALKEIQGTHFQSPAAKLASRAGMGSLSRAQYFLDEEMWKTRNMILGLLSNPAAEWMKLVEQLALSQRQLSLGLDLLESLLSDLLLYQVHGSDHLWIHEDQKDFMIQWANQRKLTSNRIIEVMTRISENRRFVGLTLNPKLLGQQVLNPLLETLFS